MKITRKLLRNIIKEEHQRILESSRSGRLNIIFDVMGNTPQFQIQQSGCNYDLTEYSRVDYESFVQDFETDHGAQMPEGQVVHDAYGFFSDSDVLPLRQAWDEVFDAIEDM